MLAMAARYGFPVSFSAPLIDPNCSTPAGPLAGFDGDSYTYTIGGMGRYIDQRLVVGKPDPACADLEQELAGEVQKIVAAGDVLIPGVTVVNRSTRLTAPSWWNPGDNFRFLSSAASLLPNDLRAAALQYVAKVGAKAAPDLPGAIPLDKGILRHTGKAPDEKDVAALRRLQESIVGTKCYFFPGIKAIDPANLYGISQYIEAGGSWDLDGRWGNVMKGITPFLKQTDWATMGWFRWEENIADAGKWGVRHASLGLYGCGGVQDANRWFVGTMGLARLAKIKGDQPTEIMGRYLFAKAAALRFGMAKFARFYYDTGRLSSPSDKQWYVKAMAFGSVNGSRDTSGYPFALEWNGPEDDIRQVVVLDEVGATLRVTPKHYMNETIPAFDVMVPELARFLQDHLRPECATYIKHTISFIPDWEVAYGDAALGSETSFTMPDNAHQIFMAKAYVLDEKPDKLRERLDIPWVVLGDYFYIDKLVATIRAYRGMSWQPAR